MHKLSEKLLAWYDVNHRDLPWRISPKQQQQGIKPNPYYIWLSEIMLQQTTVAAVKSYFENFIARWPNICALATAREEEVLAAWAGLGYYARARNLHRCAKTIMRDYHGIFPQDYNQLIKLPGIGDYTASAISTIAFNQSMAVVDGNVARIITRQFAIETELAKAKKLIKQKTAEVTPLLRAGDFAQAMMDLASKHCAVKNPSCKSCPISQSCQAFRKGVPQHFPVKAPKKNKPRKWANAYVIIYRDKLVFLKKRPAQGLLANMAEVPFFMVDDETHLADIKPPLSANWRAFGQIEHVFTHFYLTTNVYGANIQSQAGLNDGWWCDISALNNQALPSLMKKILKSALTAQQKS